MYIFGGKTVASPPPSAAMDIHGRFI